MSPGPQIVALLLSETSLGLTRIVSFPMMLSKGEGAWTEPLQVGPSCKLRGID